MSAVAAIVLIGAFLAHLQFVDGRASRMRDKDLSDKLDAIGKALGLDLDPAEWDGD